MHYPAAYAGTSPKRLPPTLLLAPSPGCIVTSLTDVTQMRMCCSPTQPAAQAAHQGSHMLVICSIVYCMCNAYTFAVAALAFFGKVNSRAALQCLGRVIGAKNCVRDIVSE